MKFIRFDIFQCRGHSEEILFIIVFRIIIFCLLIFLSQHILLNPIIHSPGFFPMKAVLSVGTVVAFFDLIKLIFWGEKNLWLKNDVTDVKPKIKSKCGLITKIWLGSFILIIIYSNILFFTEK